MANKSECYLRMQGQSNCKLAYCNAAAALSVCSKPTNQFQPDESSDWRCRGLDAKLVCKVMLRLAKAGMGLDSTYSSAANEPNPLDVNKQLFAAAVLSEKEKVKPDCRAEVARLRDALLTRCLKKAQDFDSQARTQLLCSHWCGLAHRCNQM